MTVKTPQSATLIDTLSEGYRVINRRPWLLLMPIILNLYLWFGAQISFGPLFGDLASFIQRTQPADVRQELDPVELASVLSQLDMRQQLAVLNFIPTLTVTRLTAPGEAAAPISGAQPIEVSSVGGALLFFVALNAIALPLSAAFLITIADGVRGARAGESAPPWLRRALRAALAILGYVAILAGVAGALGLPFLFFAALLGLIHPNLFALALSLMYLIGFWVWVYVGFANEAIVIGEMGPLRAIHASFNVVRRNFWGTIGLLVLSFIITAGLGVLWSQLVGSLGGQLLAIAGSAYIGCGLIAARMVFFRDRLRRWQEAPKPAR